MAAANQQYLITPYMALLYGMDVYRKACDPSGCLAVSSLSCACVRSHPVRGGLTIVVMRTVAFIRSLCFDRGVPTGSRCCYENGHLHSIVLFPLVATVC